MHRLLFALLLTVPLFACSCWNTATPCSEIGGSKVVFLGRVLVDSGEGLGTGPARVIIEEPFSNVPKGLHEVEVNTSAGTSCYYRLKAGDRYVVFASKGDGAKASLLVTGCSNTFPVQGN